MSTERPKPSETALLADFLTAISMTASGSLPLPVVEAIAQREDDRAQKAGR